jgi:putative FmdB family regulatory protein
MPLYEYACSSCSHQFEELRLIRHMEAAAKCPECEGEGERQMSVFASFSTSSNGESKAIAGGVGGCCGGGTGAGCACSMTA